MGWEAQKVKTRHVGDNKPPPCRGYRPFAKLYLSAGLSLCVWLKISTKPSLRCFDCAAPYLHCFAFICILGAVFLVAAEVCAENESQQAFGKARWWLPVLRRFDLVSRPARVLLLEKALAKENSSAGWPCQSTGREKASDQL